MGGRHKSEIELVQSSYLRWHVCDTKALLGALGPFTSRSRARMPKTIRPKRRVCCSYNAAFAHENRQ